MRLSKKTESCQINKSFADEVSDKFLTSLHHYTIEMTIVANQQNSKIALQNELVPLPNWI